ncbi:MAG: hypothetical protein WKF66_20855 [Pedobacter sp.]
MSLIFFLLFCSKAYGQLKPVQSIAWISEEMHMMRFVGSDVTFEPNREGEDYLYYLSIDTLVLVDKVFPSNEIRARAHKFLMSRKGNELLILTPINDNAKRFSKVPYYTFRNTDYTVDHTLKFKSLHYNVGGCAGCGLRTVNIDNKGNCYVKKGAGLDTGYFKGKLSSMQLDTLNNLLQRSGIRKLQGWIPDRWLSSGAAKNVVIEYNGNILRMKNRILPWVTRDLLQYVQLSAIKLPLVPDVERYNYKRDGDETTEYKSDIH